MSTKRWQFSGRSAWLAGWKWLLLPALLVALLWSPAPLAAQSCSHTVRPGDTLAAIAARNNTTVSAILAVNPQITRPNRIRVGEQVQLPSCGVSGTAPFAPGNSAPSAPSSDVVSPTALQTVPPPPAELAPNLWKRTHDATITIRHPIGRPVYSGSGIVIGQDGRTFLTAYHVIGNVATGEATSRVMVGPFADWKYTADVIAADPTLDLAVLRVREPDFPGFAVAPLGRSMSMGPRSPIYTLSYPGIDAKLVAGKGHWLTEVITWQNRAPLIITDAPATFGSSGGVAVNERGEVIGIITAGIIGAEPMQMLGFRDIDHATMLVPIEAAWQLLDQAGVQR